jgi:predicted HTH transcriptional regulator
MRFGSLRTVAAFLNSDGGVLYLGVGDNGVPVGLDGDFALIEDASPCDVFENRFREFMKNSLDPLPLNDVVLSFQEMEGHIVCVVTVVATGGVTYLLHKDDSGQKVESVFVRDGNRTIKLDGRGRDSFVRERN